LFARNIQIDLILYLIGLGANVHSKNEGDKNILQFCSTNMQPEKYDLLVQKFYERGETEIFSQLDEHECTPLFSAVENLELLDSTIKTFATAMVDFKFEGSKILFHAVERNRSARVLEALVQSGADIFARNEHGRSLLHEAAIWGSLTACNYFIFRGCDVDATDQDGETPLHLALGRDKFSSSTHRIVESLVQHEANVNAVNNKKQTPLSIANYVKIEHRTVMLLKSLGAR